MITYNTAFSGFFFLSPQGKALYNRTWEHSLQREDKDVLDYAGEQIKHFFAQSYHWIVSIAIGSGFWQLMQDQFGSMFLTNAFFWLPTLWAISWVCGGLWARKEGRYSRTKAAHSVWKLIGYIAMLVVAHAFRHFTVVGGYPASIIEIACIAIEGYNALENAAGLTDIAWLKKFIGFSKIKLQDQLGRMVGMVEEVRAENRELASKVAEVKAEVTEVKATTEVLVQSQEISSNTAATSGPAQNSGDSVGKSLPA